MSSMTQLFWLTSYNRVIRSFSAGQYVPFLPVSTYLFYWPVCTFSAGHYISFLPSASPFYAVNTYFLVLLSSRAACSATLIFKPPAAGIKIKLIQMPFPYILNQIVKILQITAGRITQSSDGLEDKLVAGQNSNLFNLRLCNKL
jgi:hypothetical protein